MVLYYYIIIILLQLRSDWYTYIVLSALPWVAGELLSKRQTELDRILTTIDTYMRYVYNNTCCGYSWSVF